jgi:hypothetical protein
MVHVCRKVLDLARMIYVFYGDKLPGISNTSNSDLGILLFAFADNSAKSGSCEPMEWVTPSVTMVQTILPPANIAVRANRE